MTPPDLYPLKFHEIFKPYVWGGRNLERIGKALGGRDVVAESWELADHGEDVSVVRNGPLAGAGLRELVDRFGEDISPSTSNGRFPILAKFIDAYKRLSVQVHPADEYARTHECPGELGKTEFWFVMSATPQTLLVMGLEGSMTRERFESLVRKNRIEEGLNYVPVRRGDAFYIETGTVHALLEGTMVCEIQENSDVTYRLHDWGRVDGEGRSRALHVEKALDVIHYPGGGRARSSPAVAYDPAVENAEVPLVRSRYFNVDYLRLTREKPLGLEGAHFHCLTILSGSGALAHARGSEPVRTGETVLIPRPLRSYRLETRGMELLKTFL